MKLFNLIRRHKLLRQSKAILIVFIFLYAPVALLALSPSNDCDTNAGQQINVGCVCNPIAWNINTTLGLPSPASCGGSTPVGPDGWGWFQAIATSTIISYTNTNQNTDAVLYLYSGTCGSLTLVGCSNAVTFGTETINATTVVGQNYFVRVVKLGGNGPPLNGNLCVYSLNPPTNDEPCSAQLLNVNGACTYSTYTNACATASTSVSNPGCAGYLGGDVWFKLIVPASGGVTIQTNSAGVNDGGMAVYSGVCSSLALFACDDNNGPGSMPMIAATCFPPGTTLWIRFWSNGNTNNGTFQICAYDTHPPAVGAADEPCSATPLAAGTSCSYSTYTNQCATASSGIPAPGCAGYGGGDVWFSITVPPSGTLTVTTNTGTISDGGMAIYKGSCSSLTLVSCDDDNGPGLMPSISLTCLSPGTTLWIRFWENGNNNNGTFQICAYETTPVACGAAPPNDFPCNAISLPIGVTLNGTNYCSGSCNEPPVPSCWTNGALNTVWYSIICPATGKIRVRTYLGTLTNTMIALYSGSCTSLALVAGASSCNDDATPCPGAPAPLHSEILVTGLVPGQMYYLVVDGYNNLTGTFNVTASDGSPFAPVPQQDCSYMTQICSQITTVGDPGFVGAGNSCDFSTPYSCFAFGGETNSVFYTFTMASAGTLLFDITPNLATTDYDFMLWDVTGLTNPCVSINAGSLSPLRCNFSGTTGTTGIRTGYTGTSVAANGPPFCAPVAATAGQQFILMLNNYSSNFTGYNLNFGTSPLSYSSAPTSLVWTGGVNTDWFNALNWGGCSIPACGIDAIIVNGPTNQPAINAPGAVCQSITINPGAILTIVGANTFRVCQDFTNNGTLNAGAGSTMLFNNTNVIQNINGNLVGTSKFSNLMISKTTGGSVSLNQSIDIGLTFTTANAASVFNTNGNYVKVGGNFNNSGGNSTFSSIGNGALEFFGSAAQTFTNTTGSLTLNNVVMNHSGAGVTLSGVNSNLIIGTNGTLTMNNGKIITGATNEVSVLNTAPSAVTTGGPTSFVNGFLRRAIGLTTGAYDFPVGNSTKGFQRAKVDFISAPAGTFSLLASFNNWSTVPNGPVSSECQFANYSLFPAFDNGYWTLNASTTGITALYNITLYNLNYTNSTGSLMWTVMKRSPSGTGTWSLNGSCDNASSASGAVRDSLTGFSDFATVQYNSPLPIHLLSFTANRKENSVRCEWITATEINNDYFIVQRSLDLIKTEEVGIVDGAGNSTASRFYSFTDESPLPALTYYRLKQVDFNGDVSFSDWEAVPFRIETNQLFLYPNPASTLLNCEFLSSEKKEINVVITDVLGKIMFREKKNLESGLNHFEIDIQNLADGFYFIHASDQSECTGCMEHPFKFIKQSR